MTTNPEYTLTREEAFKLAGLGDIIEKADGQQFRLEASPSGGFVDWQWRSSEVCEWSNNRCWDLPPNHKYRVIKAEPPKRYMKDLSEMETPGLKAVIITFPDGNERGFSKGIGWTEFKYVYADFALRHGLSVEMVFEGDA